MKTKKILAGVSAAAMAVSAMSVFSVSTSAVAAGATSIDFEDGDFSFVYMNVDDKGADDSTLSVESFNGSNQLKVDVTTASKTPKVWFDLDSICDRAVTTQINSIEMDLTFVPKDPEKALGWIGGQIGAAGGFDMNASGKGQKNPDWSSSEWSCEDANCWEIGLASTQHVVKKFLLPSSKYTEEGTNPFFGVMAWGNGDTSDYVMYIDNVVLKDKSGNALTLGVTPAETEAAPEETAAEETTAAPEETAAEETTAAPEETEAAPAETEAAPAAAADFDGTVITDTEATSDGAWGQAITIQTIKNEGGSFDPSILTADKAVVVYYEADTAPEVVLQSWSGGAGWAKVPANEDYSTPGVAVFTYDYMTAMYESDNFVDTLDAFIVGDTGSALKVTKVLLVDAASLGGEAAAPVVEEAPAETEAAPAETEAAASVETTPAVDSTTTAASTGNTSAAAVASVMVLAAVAAVATKKRK
ncbi:MAG: hypothetical protein ACI4KF_02110 [Huintestinicola sp.]